MAAGTTRIFLLSPARASGARAGMLLREEAAFELAVRLRAGQASVGELFAFASGLYFRGKLAYARAFARPASQAGVWVMAPGLGLIPAEATLTREALRAMGEVAVEAGNPAFRRPLERDAQVLAQSLPQAAQVVLLGSIASPKYVDPLLATFGARLHFPLAFVGRGDMSRGGLLLRCVREARELDYGPVAGAPRRGRRPPKLPPLRP